MSHARTNIAVAAVSTLAVLVATAGAARSSTGTPWNIASRAQPVTSVFFIAKSQNRNQVHYGVRVDSRCRTTSHAPVYAYWRDLEVGPQAVSRLLGIEEPVYGIGELQTVENGPDQGRVSFTLRAFPKRPLVIQTFGKPGACQAWALTSIGKEPALLRSIYVAVGFLFSVDYVLLDGFRLSDGAAVREKLR
jgi:hypothetical protein